jgi:hypothetical protein
MKNHLNALSQFLLIFLILFPIFGHCDSVESLLSGNKRGIQIVSDLTSDLSPQQKKEAERKNISEKKLGYIKTDENVAKFLLTIKDHAKQEIEDNKNSKYGDYDTHLKAHYSDIKLSFPFHGICIAEENIIGYAAMGTFLKNNEKPGWTGIRVFFNQPGSGICSYSRMAIETVLITPEEMKNLINNKPSTRIIEGNIISGFVYRINWYTANLVKTLECANLSFNKEIIDKMVALADKIDKEQTLTN